MLLTAILLVAQVPAPAQKTVPKDDSRNTNTPNTDTHATLPNFHTLQDWEKRKTQLRKQILSAAGLYPMPERSPLHAEVFGRLQREDYTIEKVLLETLPGYYLGGNLYRPLNHGGKLPGILNPHGHWTYGRLENQDLFSGRRSASILPSKATSSSPMTWSATTTLYRRPTNSALRLNSYGRSALCHCSSGTPFALPISSPAYPMSIPPVWP